MTETNPAFGNIDTAFEMRDMFGAEKYNAFVLAALDQITLDLAFIHEPDADWTDDCHWQTLHRAIGTSGVIGAERLSAFLMQLEKQKTSDGTKPSDDEVAMLRDLVSGTDRFFRQVRAGELG